MKRVFRKMMAVAILALAVNTERIQAAAEVERAPSAEAPLQNGSFEEMAGAGPRQWSTRIWGGNAELTVGDGGRNKSRCVRIESAGGGDATWTATVDVSPHGRYRLTGWIRTRDVVQGSGYGALLNVHELPGVVTQSVNGNSDWRKVEVEFDTLGRGSITVNALLGGWGTSTGTAWYDDLHLAYLGEAKRPVLRWPTPSGNPVIADCIADPSVSEFDGVFYLTATTDDCPREGVGRWYNGPAVVWRSTDLRNWSFEGHLMPETNDKLYWAPSRIIKRGERYLLFPSIDSKIRVAAADSPEGPFRLIAGTDTIPLLDTIDAEVFVDDDDQGYLFSNHRKVWRMNDELTAMVGEPMTIQTGRQGYSEGPIVFKRAGIYYYLYTLSGHESYHYAYGMSHTSPLGPYETPGVDIIAKSDPAAGIYGPGHGSVFSLAGTDDYYFIYLEYGRGGVTRQVCIDRMEFNADGTIRPIKLTTTGIEPLARASQESRADSRNDVSAGEQVRATASSQRDPIDIQGISNPKLLIRQEDYLAERSIDRSNFTRWQPAEQDKAPWLMLDMGKAMTVYRSELSFYRPTLGHAYRVETSLDGTWWIPVFHHDQPRIRSPQVDRFSVRGRYWRVSIQRGHHGVWEWRLFGAKSAGS